ncbi:dihydroorotate dehydrogenase electron transfer subunit [Heyndrickxia sp. NPDC080065]|uniref:dihydroorotate dehydrogenase electron transfer subunit n=1 Tax=Heyndrickxia sp. NPDC080065 TaxID=3390568 RepID=UPI003D02E706
MIKQEKMKVISHQLIAENIYELTLEGSLVNEMNQPGQFVHLRVADAAEPLLRRPISIAEIDKENRQFTMIYRAEGKGTKLLSHKKQGETIDVLGPLGNGFPVERKKGEKAVLVGGGIGVPPLYELSKRLVRQGVEVIHILGHETESKVFYVEQFKSLGKTYIATVDGSLGTKGFVTDVMDQENLAFDCLFACGPMPMLKALENNYSSIEGYISLEKRMGCGIGACLACVCQLSDDPSGTKYRKVCSDGPVFRMGEVIL